MTQLWIVFVGLHLCKEAIAFSLTGDGKSIALNLKGRSLEGDRTALIFRRNKKRFLYLSTEQNQHRAAFG